MYPKNKVYSQLERKKKKKKDNQISLYTVKFYIEIALRFFLF